jgi:ABC-2 type transport system ATP-binding protein
MIYDGEPAQGIRILRDGYQADRLLDLDRHGKQRFALEVAEFRAETRVDGDAVHLTAYLDVDVNEPVPDWGVGFSIENTLGLRLYNMTTFDQLTLPTTVGRHSLKFEIPDVHLGPGKYLVNIGLGDAHGQNFDLATPAGSFDVPGRDYGNGVLRLRPTVSVAP